jgi:anti-anti-sigma factor
MGGNGELGTCSPTYFLADDLAGTTAIGLAKRLEKLPIERFDTIVLSLREVEHIDASGLAVLVRLYSRLASTKRQLVLRDISPPIAELLEGVGLGSVFEDRSFEPGARPSTAVRLRALPPDQPPREGVPASTGQDALETDQEHAAPTHEEPDAALTPDDPDAAPIPRDPDTAPTPDEPDAALTQEDPDAALTQEDPDAAPTQEEPDAAGADEDPDALGADPEEDASAAHEEPASVEADHEIAPVGVDSAQDAPAADLREQDALDVNPQDLGALEADPEPPAATDLTERQGAVDQPEAHAATGEEPRRPTLDAVFEALDDCSSDEVLALIREIVHRFDLSRDQLSAVLEEPAEPAQPVAATPDLPRPSGDTVQPLLSRTERRKHRMVGEEILARAAELRGLLRRDEFDEDPATTATRHLPHDVQQMLIDYLAIDDTQGHKRVA